MTRVMRQLFAVLPMLVPPEAVQAIRDVLESSRGDSKKGDADIEAALHLLQKSADFRVQREAFEYAMQLDDGTRRTFWHHLLYEPANDDSRAFDNSVGVTVASTQHRLKTGHDIEYFRGADKLIIAAKCHACTTIWRVASRTTLDD